MHTYDQHLCERPSDDTLRCQSREHWAGSTEKDGNSRTASRSSTGSCWITIAKLRDTLFNTSTVGKSERDAETECTSKRCRYHSRSAAPGPSAASWRPSPISAREGVQARQFNRRSFRRLCQRAFTWTKYGSASGSFRSSEMTPISCGCNLTQRPAERALRRRVAYLRAGGC
jgi:hypothetical protein